MFILLLLIVSVAAGVGLQRFRPLRHVERTTTWTVWLLIFFFGISLGSNDEIVNDFGRFGFTAVVVALAGIAGSVLAAWFFGRYIDKSKKK